MVSRLDWKFWLGLCAAIAGVLVPVWLWRADLDARSLNFRVLSQTALQSPEAAKVEDFSIHVGGVQVKAPYLSVVELVNDGARPILASDFEGSLELRIAPSSSVIRASVEGVTPTDLNPVIRFDTTKVELAPLLLNPKDSVRVAILTSGDLPQLDTRARIAGVGSVPVVGASKKPSSPLSVVILGAGVLLFLLSGNLVAGGWPTRGAELRPRAAFVVYFAGMGGAGLLLLVLLESLGFDGFLPLLLAFTVANIIVSFAADLLNAKTPRAPPPGGA